MKQQYRRVTALISTNLNYSAEPNSSGDMFLPSQEGHAKRQMGFAASGIRQNQEITNGAILRLVYKLGMPITDVLLGTSKSPGEEYQIIDTPLSNLDVFSQDPDEPVLSVDFRFD